MKTVIAGAGAIGAFLGAHLARAGADVVLYARGPHLQAMRERGLRVVTGDGGFHVRPSVTDDLGRIGPVDLVVLAVKAHSLAGLAPRLAPLVGPATIIVSTQNGLPWWYFHEGTGAAAPGGPLHGFHLEAVDPGGVVTRALDPARVVGAIVYFATAVEAPGVIRQSGGSRMLVGEPGGVRSARVGRVAGLFEAAGLRCEITGEIRREIWAKLLGNVAFNPLSVITGATVGELVGHPDGSRVVRAIMGEVEAVARRLDLAPAVSIDERMARASQSGPHRTSMLQDFEAGRPLELDAIVGSVIAVADRLGVPVPSIRAVEACVRMLDERRVLKKDGGSGRDVAG
ncbi:MAG: 2-dehydropantoate 2-reductase [Acidobacteriota bacterium]|nr:2-dehydropantoate 2-reductase [Acidobacteriota bacterium]